ncbi:MAG: hypothetical protein IJ391_01105 [Clostridia bacterium]|nr:hypothetical protein [Clostridia bacterium]
MKNNEKIQENTAELNRRKKNSYKLIAIIALCILFAAVYFAVIGYEAANGFKNSIIMQVYAYTDAALLLAFFILNGGLSKGVPTPEMFDNSVPREKAERTIAIITRCKKIAKPLLFFIIPLTFTLFADILFLLWGDFFTDILNNIKALVK